MADSYITKRALAGALKELMEERSFSGISVAGICEKCEMNRKSFYYHFRDKYDLVNWIFDTEFISVICKGEASLSWDMMKVLCDYFYENRDFYRKVLSVEGQNSFSDHFHELLYQLFQTQLRDLEGAQKATNFQINFLSDAIVMTIRRWMMSRDCMKPEEFLAQIKICAQCIVAVAQASEL